jgi:hypothetical protein
VNIAFLTFNGKRILYDDVSYVGSKFVSGWAPTRVWSGGGTGLSADLSRVRNILLAKENSIGILIPDPQLFKCGFDPRYYYVSGCWKCFIYSLKFQDWVQPCTKPVLPEVFEEPP